MLRISYNLIKIRTALLEAGFTPDDYFMELGGNKLDGEIPPGTAGSSLLVQVVCFNYFCLKCFCNT